MNLFRVQLKRVQIQQQKAVWKSPWKVKENQSLNNNCVVYLCLVLWVYEFFSSSFFSHESSSSSAKKNSANYPTEKIHVKIPKKNQSLKEDESLN